MSKVTRNLGMTGQEICKTISSFGKDDFALASLQIEKLVGCLEGYMRSGIE